MVFVECCILMGQLKWNVTGNAIIVIFTNLSVCLLDCMYSVVHKMTHARVEVSVQCGGRKHHNTILCCHGQHTKTLMAGVSINS
jgi:hypothetical protein